MLVKRNRTMHIPSGDIAYWVVDSGASDYMCHDITLFDDYSEIHE